MTSDLLFLNIYNLFTKDRIMFTLDTKKNKKTTIDSKDYFVKQISHCV